MRWVLSRVFSAAFWLFVSGIGYTGVTYGEGANTNGMKTIEGSVWYRERMALPPNAEIRIALENVARMDAPSEVIAIRRVQRQIRGFIVPLQQSLLFEQAARAPHFH